MKASARRSTRVRGASGRGAAWPTRRAGPSKAGGARDNPLRGGAISSPMSLALRSATPDDAATIHALIVALADYVREPDAVANTPDILRTQLAAARPPFECLLAEE